MDIKAKIMEALSRVQDPELHKDLVTLGMIKEISLQGDLALIEVTLTIKGCPLKNKIREDVIQEVKKVEGINRVEVVFGEMTQAQREAMVAKLRGGEPKPVFEGVQVIALGSGKGGVGKSTATANLAVALARLGYKVGLIDADILGFSIPRLLGVSGVKPTILGEKQILPVPAHGIKMISMGSFTEGEDVPLVWRGPVLSGVLEQFFNDVVWGDLDYLLIDLPPGTGDVPLTIMQRIPNAKFLLITTPQASASHVAGRVAHMARKANIQVLGIIENMSYFICDHCTAKHHIFGQGETANLAKALKTEILGEIPLETSVRERSDNGTPVALDASHPVGKIYEEVARRVADRLKSL